MDSSWDIGRMRRLRSKKTLRCTKDKGLQQSHDDSPNAREEHPSPCGASCSETLLLAAQQYAPQPLGRDCGIPREAVAIFIEPSGSPSGKH